MRAKATKCSNCLWNGMCQTEKPCNHYTPVNYEELFAEEDAERTRRWYYEEWREYEEYYDD